MRSFTCNNNSFNSTKHCKVLELTQFITIHSSQCHQRKLVSLFLSPINLLIMCIICIQWDYKTEDICLSYAYSKFKSNIIYSRQYCFCHQKSLSPSSFTLNKTDIRRLWNKCQRCNCKRMNIDKYTAVHVTLLCFQWPTDSTLHSTTSTNTKNSGPISACTPFIALCKVSSLQKDQGWAASLASSSSSVFMGQLHLIWQIYVFQSLPILVVVVRCLRSATHGDLQVPRTRMVTYGPQSFAVSGPTIWNTLPSTLCVSTTTLGQFQSGLKTMLFRLAYGTWLSAFTTVQIRLAPYKLSYLLTYLLTPCQRRSGYQWHSWARWSAFGQGERHIQISGGSESIWFTSALRSTRATCQNSERCCESHHLSLSEHNLWLYGRRNGRLWYFCQWLKTFIFQRSFPGVRYRTSYVFSRCDTLVYAI